MRKFKLYKIIFVFAFLFTFSSTFAFADSIYVNNYKLDDTKTIKALDGRTYIAIQDFTRAIGGTYYYDQNKKSATISYNDLTLDLFNYTKKAKLNGKSLTLKQLPFFNTGNFYIPVTILNDLYGKKLSWDYNRRILYINSNPKYATNSYQYNKTALKNMEKAMGKDFKLFNFTYVLTNDIKFEKNLPNGKYFIFRASDKNNSKNKLNGYFYYNIYSNEVFYYPIDNKEIKKYSNGSVVKEFNPTGYTHTDPLIATTRLISTINSSDSSLANFSYKRNNSIDKTYLKYIPKADYYYYKAEKKEKNKVVSSFYVAQNMNSLETYLFLKQKNGINIVKLPDLKLIKTIKLK